VLKQWLKLKVKIYLNLMPCINVCDIYEQKTFECVYTTIKQRVLSDLFPKTMGYLAPTGC
jgi:hypothetical protein